MARFFSLDFDGLLDAFVGFWREHAESFLDRQPYSEAASQLVRMAYFLERLGLDRGTLMIFDQRPSAAPFAERGTREKKTVDGRDVLVLRL